MPGIPPVRDSQWMAFVIDTGHCFYPFLTALGLLLEGSHWRISHSFSAFISVCGIPYLRHPLISLVTSASPGPAIFPPAPSVPAPDQTSCVELNGSLCFWLTSGVGVFSTSRINLPMFPLSWIRCMASFTWAGEKRKRRLGAMSPKGRGSGKAKPPHSHQGALWFKFIGKTWNGFGCWVQINSGCVTHALWSVQTTWSSGFKIWGWLLLK